MKNIRNVDIYDYTLGIVCTAVLVLISLLQKLSISNLLLFVILIGVNIAIDIFTIKIGKVTLAFVPIVELSALIIFGVTASALIQLITVFFVDKIINKKPISIVFLNIGLMTSSVFAGGMAYHYVFGLLGSSYGRYLSSIREVPAAAYFMASLATNYLLIYIHFLFTNIKQFQKVFISSLLLELASIIISLPLALSFSDIYLFSHDNNTLFAVLFLLPVIFICFIFSLTKKVFSANNQLKALSKVALTINSYLDLEKTYRSIIDAVYSFVYCKGCYIFDVNEQQKEMRPLFYRVGGEDNIDGYSLTIKGSLMERVCSSKKPVIIDEPDRSWFTIESSQCANMYGSCILIPMRRLDRCVGCIGAFSYEIDESDDKAIFEFLMTLSDQATIAIENARLYMMSEERAVTDGLTNLFNHRYFYSCLEEKTREYKDECGKISLILFDIDHFKSINDKYGHMVGDCVLREIALLIKNSVRKGDIVSRYGGEEFAVILPALDSNGAYIIAERIRERVQENDFVIDGCHIKVTLSGGISEFPQVASNDVELVNYADRAMYSGAKYSGRNRVKIYDGKLA